MPVFNIHHITKYEYDRPVKESVNEIRIYPYSGPEQEILYHELNITDHPEVMQVTDYWGNRSGMFNLLSAHKELVIESKLIVRTISRAEYTRQGGAGFDYLKSDIANNLSLLELSRIEETGLRNQLNTLTKEI